MRVRHSITLKCNSDKNDHLIFWQTKDQKVFFHSRSIISSSNNHKYTRYKHELEPKLLEYAYVVIINN